jgi:hypothetical protein
MLERAAVVLRRIDAQMVPLGQVRTMRWLPEKPWSDTAIGRGDPYGSDARVEHFPGLDGVINPASMG